MSVRYIFGRAGRGKSYLVLREIKEKIEAGRNKLFLIVPEQFTLQAERDLIEKMHLPGIMRVEVLSFTRLAHKVFNEVGGASRIHISEQGKNMVLRKVIDEVEDELTVYKNVARHDGFIARFGELLSEMKRNDIAPEDLFTKALELGQESLLRKKLHDIACIYKKFNEYLRNRYIDTEDSINFLIEKIEQAHFLKDSEIWIDGFHVFTSQTYRVIEKLMLLAKGVTFTIVMDNGASRDREIFKIHELMYKNIHELAKKHGIDEEYIDLNKNGAGYIKSPEIAHVEKELYAYPFRKFEGKLQNLELFAGVNRYTEIENMAAQIVSLVRDRGYRWSDIAVVCNDLENYGSIIKCVFSEYGIPCFIDQKKPIMNNPIIEFILSALGVIGRGYRYEDVFRFLKTGFCGLESDEWERLENYALKYGIKGRKWKEAFNQADTEDLDNLNEIREKFIAPLAALEEKIRGKGRKRTVKDITLALYDYLKEVKLYERIEEWVGNLRRESAYEYVNENTQIWNIVMEIFDQLVEILGDQPVSLGEYIRLLEAGFTSLDVGIIPSGIDEVLVGNITRSKSHDIKALFVVGVNDGIIPSANDDENILTDEEKLLLKEMRLDFGSDSDFASCEEKYLIYSALTKPAEYLWLSYAMADQEGRALRPSILIERFKKLFPGIRVKSDVVNDAERQLHMIATPESTFKYLVQNIRMNLDGKPIEDMWWDVYDWYYRHDEWDDRRKAVVRGFFHKNQINYVESHIARKLYNFPVRASVSRLEQFVNCPFSHFVKYGLRPAERETFEIESPDIGMFFHKSIELFAEKLKEGGLNWKELDEETADTIVDSVVDEIVPSYGSGVLLSTRRYTYLVKRLKKIIRRTAWMLTEHLKNSGFEVLDHELEFGFGKLLPPVEIKLPDGEKFYLEGRIDRIDVFDDDGCAYIKIIDYKSGDDDFALSDVYYGLKLQLIVYLYAVMAGSDVLFRKDVKPAGVFYFKIDDPLVKTKEKTKEAVEREKRKKLKMKGIALKDVRIIRELDRKINGYSDIIPVGISKNGEFYKNSSVLDEEVFAALVEHVLNLIKKITREMIKGNICINPVKIEKHTACKWCPYRGICQFDSMFENSYRIIKRLSKEEVIEKITCGGEADDSVD